MEEPSHEEPTISRRVKYGLTAACYFCYFAYGFGFSVIGPTMLDLKELIGANMSEISYGLVVRSAVYCVGALVCGWAFNLYNRQICFAIALLGIGIGLVIMPHLRSLLMYLVAQGSIGFASAGIDVAGNAWMLEMWQHESNPYMQGMHFSYALGATISPLIVIPFLSPDKPINNGTITPNGTEPNSTYAYLSPSYSNSTDDGDESQIHIPYAMVSSVSFLASMLLVIFYVNNPYKDPLRTLSTARKPNSGLNNSGSTSEYDESINLIPISLPTSYYATIISLGALILCFYAGIELNTFTYLQTFVVHVDLHLSKSTGALMTSMVTAAYTVSRGLSIFLATKFKTTTLLYFNMTMIAIGNIVVLCYRDTNETGIWVGLIIMGFGFSCVFPGIYAFLEERINVTNTICGFFMFASSLATTINPIIEGWYIEAHPIIFIAINLVSLSLVIVLFAALHYTDVTKRRFQAATPT